MVKLSFDAALLSFYIKRICSIIHGNFFWQSSGIISITDKKMEQLQPRNLPETNPEVIHTLSKLTQLIALIVMPGKQ